VSNLAFTMNLEKIRIPPPWALTQQDEAVTQYTNPDGDHLSVNYFAKVPDIAADPGDLIALRAFYRSIAAANQLALIEVDVAELDGVKAVRTLFKVRLNPRGFAFIGSYTLPFSDQSFVVKVQSAEQGITGMREAAVMMGVPTVETDDVTGKIIGWEQDPYDASFRGEFMRNQADDPRYDAQFPVHPLSKIRRYLADLSHSVEVDKSLRKLSPFTFGRPRSLWSRLWS